MWPEKRLTAEGGRLFVLQLDGEGVEFLLNPSTHLLASHLSADQCLFHGVSTTHDDTTLSLHGCGEQAVRVFTLSSLSIGSLPVTALLDQRGSEKSERICSCFQRGLIVTPSGHFVVHPIPASHLHRVKRSAVTPTHIIPHLLLKGPAEEESERMEATDWTLGLSFCSIHHLLLIIGDLHHYTPINWIRILSTHMRP